MGRLGEPLEALPDDVAHRRGDGVGPEEVGVEAHELGHEERVAARAVDDGIDDLGIDGVAGRLPHQLDDLVSGEAGQLDAGGGALAGEVGEELPDLGPVRLVAAEGGDDEDGGAR